MLIDESDKPRVSRFFAKFFMGWEESTLKLGEMDPEPSWEIAEGYHVMKNSWRPLSPNESNDYIMVVNQVKDIFGSTEILTLAESSGTFRRAAGYHFDQFPKTTHLHSRVIKSALKALEEMRIATCIGDSLKQTIDDHIRQIQGASICGSCGKRS